MTTKGRKSAAFVTLLMLLVLPFSAAWAGPDFDEASALSPLEKIYGDGDRLHKPGLPDAGVLRVYWFWSASSHCSTRAEPAIEALQDAFGDVEVVVVHSNADESVDQAQEGLSSRNLATTVYRDEDALLASALDARVTPEVVVVDASGLVYRGQPVRPGRGDLESFVEDVAQKWVEGQDIGRAQRRPVGCVIRKP